jgi:hypothetical protein
MCNFAQNPLRGVGLRWVVGWADWAMPERKGERKRWKEMGCAQVREREGFLPFFLLLSFFLIFVSLKSIQI